jgi:SagB-type dehydrogenase family enzyme
VITASVKLRSARCQLTYWENGELRIVNFLTRRKFATNPISLEVIRFFFTPHTVRDALLEFSSYSSSSVVTAVRRLMDAGLLLRYDSAEGKRDELLGKSWQPWLPEGAFHFLTKDAAYVPGDSPIEEKLKTLPSTGPPPQFKSVRSPHVIALPSYDVPQDRFFETLHARRTHRRFSRGKVRLEDVARLLQTTWGVQGYLETAAFGKLPYKTSPSGGARHPGEVYLVARRVQGLAAGIYHYHSVRNRLSRLPAKLSPRRIRSYCAGQPYVTGAAALFIMTAVFARTMWKYRGARAYRVVLLDTGHLCQTFCLTATNLGLAPFSTAALNDSLIEQDLGIDGISESVLYVAGIGLAANRRGRRPQ